MDRDAASPDRLPGLPALVLVQGAVSAASLVVEIVAGRVLAPYVGMSLYTWTAVIAVVLAGFSAGHWIGGRIAEARAARALALTGWAMAGAAAGSGAALLVLRAAAEPVIGALDTPAAAIVALAGLAFFLPSLLAGVPAPVLASIAVARAPERAGRALGAVFAAGALGAILGTLLAGFLFISWIGSAGTLAVVTAAYAVLGLWAFAAARRAGGAIRVGLVALALALIPALATLAGPRPCTRESDYFCIRVIDLATAPEPPLRLMVLDHLAQGVAARDRPGTMFTRHAAMLERLGRARTGREAPSVFFIGGGSYAIPRAWALGEAVPDMTVAEIDPAVTRTAVEAFWFDPGGIRILHEDARRALLRRPERYDLVVGDAFTDIAVPSHLITREFFRLVAARLKPGGAYMMTVIDHADGLDALASIVRTLGEVFPTVEVWAERRASAPGERLVFVVLAAERPTPRSTYRTRAPEPLDFGRLSAGWVERLLARHEALVLTDDYAPIDRLMRWGD